MADPARWQAGGVAAAWRCWLGASAPGLPPPHPASPAPCLPAPPPLLQNLAKAAGSDPLARRVAQLRPDVHCFGHTHFSWDATIEGVRYVQAPLCSPLERQRRLRSLCFEASLPAAEADPAAATWLPLEVYRGPAAPAEGAEPPPAADVRLPLPAGPAEQVGCVPGGASAEESAQEDSVAPGIGATMLGCIEDPLGQVEDEAGHLLLRCGAGAEGSVRLRHGEMPASQGAHWSTYYGASPLGAPPAGKEAVGEGGPLPSQCTRVGTTAGTLPCPPQRRSRARPKC